MGQLPGDVATMEGGATNPISSNSIELRELKRVEFVAISRHSAIPWRQLGGDYVKNDFKHMFEAALKEAAMKDAALKEASQHSNCMNGTSSESPVTVASANPSDNHKKGNKNGNDKANNEQQPRKIPIGIKARNEYSHEKIGNDELSQVPSAKNEEIKKNRNHYHTKRRVVRRNFRFGGVQGPSAYNLMSVAPIEQKQVWRQFAKDLATSLVQGKLNQRKQQMGQKRLFEAEPGQRLAVGDRTYVVWRVLYADKSKPKVIQQDDSRFLLMLPVITPLENVGNPPLPLNQPTTPGFVGSKTQFALALDPWGEYRRIHVAPFEDTLPQDVTIDTDTLFYQVLRPFFASHPWALFAQHDTFRYAGIQFKILATDPAFPPRCCARLGPATQIFCSGVVVPTLFNLIPIHVIDFLKKLPSILRTYMIVLIIQQLEPEFLERILRARERVESNNEILSIAASKSIPFSLDDYMKRLSETSNKKNVKASRPIKNYRNICPNNNSTDNPITNNDAAVPFDKKISSNYKRRTLIIKKTDTNISNQMTAGCQPTYTGLADFATFFECGLDSIGTLTANIANEANSVIQNPMCTICATEIIEGEECLIFECSHVFHVACAIRWLKRNLTCPNCRGNVANFLSCENDESTTNSRHNLNQVNNESQNSDSTPTYSRRYEPERLISNSCFFPLDQLLGYNAGYNNTPQVQLFRGTAYYNNSHSEFFNT